MLIQLPFPSTGRVVGCCLKLMTVSSSEESSKCGEVTMVAQVSECETESEIGERTLDISAAGNSPLEFSTVKAKEHQEIDECRSENRVHNKEEICTITMAQEESEIRQKKKKKFIPAENLWCFSIVNHRYDSISSHTENVQETTDIKYVDIASDKNRPTSYLYWNEDCELMAEIYSHGRANPGTRLKKHTKVPKAQKQLKDIHFNVDQVKLSKTGNKLLKVKSDIYSRKMERDKRMAEVIESSKENVEKSLKKRELVRRGIKKVNSENQATQANTKNSKNRKKPRWSQERKEDRTFMWEVYPYALNEQEINQADKSDPETQLLWTLIQLQNRDLTPEDYDILLQLDEKVAAKTVSVDKLKSLKTQTLTDSDLASNTMFGDPCMVCMEQYDVAQTVKFLPCNHVFHELCIDNWLTNSGTKCPLDGLEVEL